MGAGARALCLAGSLLLGGCAPDGAAQAADGDPYQVAREIRDLVTALRPPAPTVTPTERNAWFTRRKRTLERLNGAGRAWGLEALERYRASADAPPEVRSGLLEVASSNAPEETRLVLVDLVAEFGDDMLVRTKAAEYLGRSAPAEAIALLRPILAGEKSGRTYPADERLLAAYVEACAATGTDPVPLLCDLAIDVRREYDVRHLATERLGDFPSNQGRQALEGLVVESTGNAYIRRKAAQSLRKTVPPAELCPTLQTILSREVDPNFQIFLDNMIQESCP